MKNLLYIFFFMVQTFGLLAQKPNQEAVLLFELANEMYKKGNYENAIQKYEYIEKSLKQESVDLYYNLGNSYYKINKTAPSIFYYEKALLLDPKNEKAVTNLEFAQKKIHNKQISLEEVGFYSVIKKTASWFSLNSWTWLSIFFSFAVFGLVLSFLFEKTSQQKKYFFVGICISLLFMLISFLMAFLLNNIQESEKTAIVFAKEIDLKAEPKSDAEKVLVLHEGTKVNVLETIDNYKKIQLPNKTEGWVLSNAIKEIR